MVRDYATTILQTTLWRCTLHGLHATSTAEIARHALVGVGTLFRCFATKEVLLAAAYDYAVAQLQGPLRTGAGEAARYERLRDQLARWWTLSAQAARAQPTAFAYWRLYRAQFSPLPTDALLLGPFAPVPALVERALAQERGLSKAHVPVSVLAASLAGQWTAALEVVLHDPACQRSEKLAQQVLEQAYAGWWQGLGLPSYTTAAKPEPR